VSSVHRGPTPAQTEGMAGVQNGEGSEGNSARASPELRRYCGSRATVVHNGEAVVLGEK
jgi:hypothetical protein